MINNHSRYFWGLVVSWLRWCIPSVDFVTYDTTVYTLFTFGFKFFFSLFSVFIYSVHILFYIKNHVMSNTPVLPEKCWWVAYFVIYDTEHSLAIHDLYLLSLFFLFPFSSFSYSFQYQKSRYEQYYLYRVGHRKNILEYDCVFIDCKNSKHPRDSEKG